VKSLSILLLAGPMFLIGCGGGSSSSGSSQKIAGPVAGNWQFQMQPPSDQSFSGGLQGGFFVNNGTLTGAVVYSVSSPSAKQNPCAAGSASVTGTTNGSDVTLTAVAGSQTFSLTGTLSSGGSTMMGTYTSTDGNGCGTAQTGLQWSATSVPAITGPVQGSFHSTGSNISPPLTDQDFAVSGVLTQGDNIGASSATVTGTLTFSGYPCLETASVNGQISGNAVILQIISSNGLNAGQIGAPQGTTATKPFPVVFESLAQGGGYVLHGAFGYGVSTKTCPGANSPGDVGNICLGMGNATGCSQPISLSPASLTFPAQGVGTSATTQTLTLTNTAGSALTGLRIAVSAPSGSLNNPSDFTRLPNFSEQDNCGASPFSLGPQQSCSITIFFAPQESCPWLPFGVPPSYAGAAPSLCPFPLAATLKVTAPISADGDTTFAVPITGTGLSAIVPSTPELDFGSEAPTETSSPQLLSFTNHGQSPIQILPALTKPCRNPKNLAKYLDIRPPLIPGRIAGLQVDSRVLNNTNKYQTISYLCDVDMTSEQPNFQISADTCTGTLLVPQGSCSLEIAYTPQPFTYSQPNALDYFLSLNTLECTVNTTSNCEIDSGRLPVELTANRPSPLRMTPGAGLDFGNQAKGSTSNPLTITLFNDPQDPNTQTVNFTGNQIIGDYNETNDCGASLAPGSSCTLTITFKPKIVGFDPGTLTIGYTVAQTQILHFRGTGQ
jgi:hypothetical protein